MAQDISKAREREPAVPQQLPSRSGRSGKHKVHKRGRPSCERSARITEDIISAATELFLERGFDDVSMEAVCERVGITKTTLYSRFGDKRALMRSALAIQVTRWNDIALRELGVLADDLKSRLIRYAQNMIVWGSKPEVLKFTRLAALLAQAEERPFHRRDTFGYSEMLEIVCRDIKMYGPHCGIVARAPNKIAEALLTLVAGRVEGHDRTEAIAAREAMSEATFLVELLFNGKDSW